MPTVEPRPVLALMNRSLILLLVVVFGCSPTSSGDPAGEAALSRQAEFAVFGPFLDSLRVAHGVPGLSFAVFDETGTLFEHVSGVKTQGTTEPIDVETVFEAASISKPVFSTIVLSLVDDGALDLDAPLGDVIAPIPEVAHDPRSAVLTPRLLLTHQGGLPNWRSRLNLGAQVHSDLFEEHDTLRFLSDPGAEYRYSGEGFVLLQSVVEAYTEQSLNALAAQRVFGPLNMNRTTFAFDEVAELNYSNGHNPEGLPNKWDLRATLSSSTLHTTASDLAKFGSHLVRVALGDPGYRALAEPAVALPERGGLSHSWGLGLGLVADGDRQYLYHGGNNVIFIADLIYGVDEGLGYVLLTNSSNGARIVEALEFRFFGRSLNR